MLRTAFRTACIALLAANLFPAQAAAKDFAVELTIKDHKFIPENVKVPADQRVRITIRNEDATPEEFESHELNREKVIPGHSTGVVIVGPLRPGTYPFIGEFHEDTAQGRIVVE